MSSTARSTRSEERRLSLRTLLIASVASATAAIVTSTFWSRGTPIAAAITPVIVSLVSELLHRPTAVIADKLTVDREALPERSAALLHDPARTRSPRRTETIDRPTLGPVDPTAEQDLAALRALREEKQGARRANGAAPPRRNGVSDRPIGGARPSGGRRLPLKAIAVTALLAFAIGTAIVTIPELVAGRSVVHGNRQFSVLGGKTHKSQRSTDTQTETQTTPTVTQTVPQDQTQTQTTPTVTETVPQKAPTQTAPQATSPTQPETTPTTPTTPTVP